MGGRVYEDAVRVGVILENGDVAAASLAATSHITASTLNVPAQAP